MKLLISIGILASLVMYLGDMLLYFTTEKFDLKDYKDEFIFEIMGKNSDKRLIFGGLCGILSAFLGAIGAFHLYYLFEGNLYWGLALSLCFAFVYIAGGAYHSHWTYLGILGKFKNKQIIDAVMPYMLILKNITVISLLLSNALIILAILLGYTSLPIYTVFITPVFWYALILLMRKLPQPYFLLISGGWGNLVFVFYYISLLIIV